MKGLFKTGLLTAISGLFLFVISFSTGGWGPCGPSSSLAVAALFGGACCWLVSLVSVVVSTPVLIVRKWREQE
jgi:hypothetical protein